MAAPARAATLGHGPSRARARHAVAAPGPRLLATARKPFANKRRSVARMDSVSNDSPPATGSEEDVDTLQAPSIASAEPLAEECPADQHAEVVALTEATRDLKEKLMSIAKLLDESVAKNKSLELALAEQKEEAIRLSDAHRLSLNQTVAEAEFASRVALEEAKMETEKLKKEYANSAVALERKIEKRLVAAIKIERDATTKKKRAEAERSAREANAVLETAKQLDLVARESFAEDADVAARALLNAAQTDAEKANAAKEHALARAASAEQQLRAQDEILAKLEALVASEGAAQQTLVEKEEAIAALTKEGEELRARYKAAAEARDEATALAEAAEIKVEDRVKDTLKAAAACVEAAEKVKTETEEQAKKDAKMYKKEKEAAELRAVAAETNLEKTNAKLDEMIDVATQKEAVDLKVTQLTDKLAVKEREIVALTEEIAIAVERTTEWEGKYTATSAVLEKRARELAELKESRDALVAAKEAAEAKATHHESTLKNQSDLLDQMAEIAAQKEAADAKIVTLQQDHIAKKKEIELLREEAATQQEAAVMWEGRATAAVAQLQARVKAAEKAAEEARATAEEKIKIVEETSALRVASDGEHLVRSAVEREVAAINAAADAQVYAAQRDAAALRRALEAANFTTTLWKARFEIVSSDLGALAETVDAQCRADCSAEVELSDGLSAGRMLTSAFVSSSQLRGFVATGPRIERGIGTNEILELDAVGLGAPLHGDVKKIDRPKPKRGRPENNAVKRDWDPEHERQMKNRLLINPRAAGLWGSKKSEDAEERVA